MANATVPPFPSLLITADAITAQGSFAESQVRVPQLEALNPKLYILYSRPAIIIPKP
jgi:hypothetical protein